MLSKIKSFFKFILDVWMESARLRAERAIRTGSYME